MHQQVLRMGTFIALFIYKEYILFRQYLVLITMYSDVPLDAGVWSQVCEEADHETDEASVVHRPLQVRTHQRRLVQTFRGHGNTAGSCRAT